MAIMVCGFHALPAQAASERVIYAFKGGMDGAYPVAGLTYMNGLLYGTTTGGGASSQTLGAGCDFVPSGCGVVFSADPAGRETVLHSFQGFMVGEEADNLALPLGGLTQKGGELFGTTYWGGDVGSPCDWGCGAVYSITAAGAVTIVHAFTGADGAYPDGSLMKYGALLLGSTSFGGGTTGYGVTFAIASNGGRRVLHMFEPGVGDGMVPSGGLVQLGDAFYGTTTQGGAYSQGTVFRLLPDGSETVLYAFKGGSDGAAPVGLVAANGRLYGTTTYGGSSGCPGGCGTVYTVSVEGVKTNLNSFKGGKFGANPTGALVEVGGRFYGTTIKGGLSNAGIVFSVGPIGYEVVEHAFKGGADGASPRGPMINVNGQLYGTTYYGGLGVNCDPGSLGLGCGTIFRISP